MYSSGKATLMIFSNLTLLESTRETKVKISCTVQEQKVRTSAPRLTTAAHLHKVEQSPTLASRQVTEMSLPTVCHRAQTVAPRQAALI